MKTPKITKRCEHLECADGKVYSHVYPYSASDCPVCNGRGWVLRSEIVDVLRDVLKEKPCQD